MNKKISLKGAVTLLLLSLLTISNTSAQNLKITPTSRLLLDGAAFSSKNVDLNDGVVLRDFRIGLKTYYGQFFFKGDISFANSKINLKDVFLQYNFNDHHFLKAGNYSPAFGLSYAYSSAKKQFMSDPSANVFQPARHIGITHSFWNKNIWLAYGAFADIKSISESTNQSGKQGFMFSQRFVYKPINAKGELLQVGFSSAYTKAEAPGKDAPYRSFTYKLPFLNSVDKTNAINAQIDHARYEGKLTVELAGIYRFLALESQYYYSHIQRREKPSFNSDGFYVSLRGILLNGKDYIYDQNMSGIITPSNKTLEMSAGYSLVDMNSDKAQIFGGKMQDFSVGLNFFLNKYVTFRGNYSYITVRTPRDLTKKVNAFQCRMQYYF